MENYTILSLETGNHQIHNISNKDLQINNCGDILGHIKMHRGTEIGLFANHSLQWEGRCGMYGGRATAFNDKKQIVGSALMGFHTTDHVAFLIDGNDYQTFDPIGRRNSTAYAINIHGRILIQCNGNRAFYYDSGELNPVMAPESYRIQANGMNDDGIMVGICIDTAQRPQLSRAFLSDGREMQLLEVLQLPSTKGWFSTARDINNHGHVVGFSGAKAGDCHGFLYDGTTMHDLGTLEGHRSYAVAINDHDEIVGYAYDVSNDAHRALLWHKGRLIDLNDVVNGTGWHLLKALDINDVGQIVGWGLLHGEVQGFLLIPAAA